MGTTLSLTKLTLQLVKTNLAGLLLSLHDVLHLLLEVLKQLDYLVAADCSFKFSGWESRISGGISTQG